MRAVVVGSGFAGLSTARHLAKKGAQVVLLERDSAPALHASGKNAGMIRQSVSDPHLARLAVEGRRSMAACESEGWPSIGFRKNGSLLLAKDSAGFHELAAIEKNLRGLSVPCEKWTHAEAERAVNVLRGADFKEALFCPGDALVDISDLLKGFLLEATRLKIDIVYGALIESIQKTQSGWTVQAAGRRHEVDVVVNAGGAWAGRIASLAKATSVPLKAYRRHLYEATVGSESTQDWPFVWDLSNDVYFRPVDSRTTLFSPCDKTLFDFSLETETGAEVVDPTIEVIFKKKLAAHLPALGEIHLKNARAALRTMVPDGRFVIGEDPALKGFFWVAGLGGHGVTTAFSVGRLAADLILGDNKEITLATALSPARFQLKDSNAA